MDETKLSPTETLMNVMEEFGESEPKEVLVIYSNEAGEICWHSTSDSIVKKLGLLEACKQYIIKKMG